jgi:hypothetical protein
MALSTRFVDLREELDPVGTGAASARPSATSGNASMSVLNRLRAPETEYSARPPLITARSGADSQRSRLHGRCQSRATHHLRGVHQFTPAVEGMGGGRAIPSVVPAVVPEDTTSIHEDTTSIHTEGMYRLADPRCGRTPDFTPVCDLASRGLCQHSRQTQPGGIQRCAGRADSDRDTR